MQFDGEAIGEITDSELSENIAASGGTTSRAGAVSLWRNSSLTLVRCIVRQNLALKFMFAGAAAKEPNLMQRKMDTLR